MCCIREDHENKVVIVLLEESSLLRSQLLCIKILQQQQAPPEASDIACCNVCHEHTLLAGCEYCERIRIELAGIVWCDHAAVLLLPLPLCLGGGSHRCHVHSIPVGLCRLRGSPPHCRHHPGPALKRHGLPDNLRHRLCPTILRSWLCAPEQMVPVWPHTLCLLPGSLAVCWRSLVEVHRAVVESLAGGMGNTNEACFECQEVAQRLTGP